jgi:hypothetical protein
MPYQILEEEIAILRRAPGRFDPGTVAVTLGR